MSNVSTDLQEVKDMLNTLATMVDAHASSRRLQSHGQSKRRHPLNWTSMRSIIDELATRIQRIEERVEHSTNDTTYDRTTGADTRNTPSEDRPRDERQEYGQNSLGSREVGTYLQKISTRPNAKSDTDVIPTRQPAIQVPQGCRNPCNPNPTGAEISSNPPRGAATPHRLRHPVDSTRIQADILMQSISEIPQNSNTTMRHRVEHGVVVLMPLNMDQCRDMPLLFSQAEKLGARETGIFKYVLPDDFVLDVPAVSTVTTEVSRFTSHLDPENISRISRTVKTETLDIGDTSLKSTAPDQLAEMLERRLSDANAMSKMRYCTDLPARTAENRQRLGLPIQSPIWPLKDSLLDRTKYVIPGLHWPYGYLSGDHGSVFTLHNEDWRIPSLNALYRGEKLWYAVAQKDGYLVENEISGWKCSQKVRHASNWIPQSKLKAMGVSFVTFVQCANEVVGVFGDTYHQGGTIGHTIAEAVNYGDPNWSTEGYSECSPKCPGYPIPRAFLEFRASNEAQREQGDKSSRKAPDSALYGGPRRVARDARRVGDPVPLRPSTNKSLRKRNRDTSPVQNRSEKRIRTAQTSMGTPIVAGKGVWNPPISQMAGAISSRAAVKQFFEIIRGRRNIEPTAFRMNPRRELSQSHDLTQTLKNDIQTINAFMRRTIYHEFIVRLSQARLAQHTEDVKQSRERVRRGVIPKILRDTGMEKRQYFHHREKGVKWREYQKMFPGLLGFIPFQTQPFGFSATEWVHPHLKATDFDSLRRQLNSKYVSALCSAGKKFEESLDLTADDFEFVGETQSISLDEASDEDLISYLRPVRTTQEIIYLEDAYPDWPRPEHWPDDMDWPADPTSLPLGAKQCMECDQSECHCASRRPEIQPRIRMYDGKGRGLQAVAREAGHIAYPKGARLGWFTGELAPPDTFHNGKCYAMFREDLLAEPEVAQINCAEVSNIYGLMNHDCEPTVILVGMRVSGKYRVGIIAKRDIRDGEEITFNYGKGYWKGNCPCPSAKHVT